MKRTLLYALSIVLTLVSAHGEKINTLSSPNGDIALSFNLLSGGTPSYTVDYKGNKVIPESKVGASFSGLRRESCRP